MSKAATAGARSGSGLWARLVLFGVSLLLTLGVLEIGLRMLGPERFETMNYPGEDWPWVVYHSVSGWINEPGFHNDSVRINSLGFRGPELPIEKPSGKVRVVFMGDSGTFGIWKPVAAGEHAFDSYTQTVERRIRESGRANVEVINAGVLGYGSSHGLRQLVTRIVRLSPDVIVVRFGFNEGALAWNPALRAIEPETALGRMLFRYFANSKLLQLGLFGYHRVRFLHPFPWSVPWVAPEQFEKDLRRFVEIASGQGVRLLFVDYPLRPLDDGESEGEHPGLKDLLGVETLSELHERHARYQAILMRVADDTDTPLVESAKACAAARVPDATAVRTRAGNGCFNIFDLVHPNDTGAEIIGGEVYDALDGRGWLDAS